MQCPRNGSGKLGRVLVEEDNTLIDSLLEKRLGSSGGGSWVHTYKEVVSVRNSYVGASFIQIREVND